MKKHSLNKKEYLPFLPLMAMFLILTAATIAPEASATAVELINPIGTKDPRVIIGNIIKAVLGLVGTVALILFIYGGITLMLSRGKSDQISKGRDTMIWAAIGLAVIFSSYSLAQYVLSRISQQ